MKKFSSLSFVLLLMLTSFSAHAQGYPRGDVNKDGAVNILDVTCLISNLLGGVPQGDANQDGAVNISDVISLINYLLKGSWPDDPTYEQMTLWHSNGSVTKVTLTERTRITFGISQVEVNDGAGNSSAYSNDDLLRLTYDDRTTAAPTGTTGESFYVYRSNGTVDGFKRASVDSLKWADNSQLIYTTDSVYRIPLNVIDSVSFIQPATELKSDVFLLTAEYNDVITEADTVTFVLSSAVPVAKRPVMGSVVLSTANCTAFPDGIMARVIGIVPVAGGMRYSCLQVGLDDVFDQLLIYAEIEAATDSTAVDGPSLHAPSRAQFTLAQELWNATFDADFSGGGVTATAHARDRASISLLVRKTRDTPWYVNIDVRNELISNFNMSAVSSADYFRSYDIGCVTVGRIPILYIYGVPVLFLTPQLTLKGYVEESGEVRLDYNGHFNRTDVSSYTYSNGHWDIGSICSNDGGTDLAEISMKGYAGIGFIPGLRFSLNGTRNGVGVNASVGVRERLDFVFDVTQFAGGRLYDACRDSYCSTTMPWTVSLFASWSVMGHAGEASTPPIISGEPKIMEDRYLLPLFTSPAYNEGNSETTAIISTTSSRRVLLPTTVGLRLYDENDNPLKSWQQGYSTTELDNVNHVTSFTGLQRDKTYHVRPTVTVMGYTIEANPLTSFKIDQEEEGDWVDLGLPSGTLWATRNVGASSPEDYGSYFAWGDTNTRSCYCFIDTAINVQYKWATLIFWDIYVACAMTKYNIYDRIDDPLFSAYFDGKTELDPEDDAAYMNWGPSWRTPTKEQFYELINYCTREWTKRNGIWGELLTSYNGNSIFFPAAEFQWQEYACFPIPNGFGYCGYYWTRQLDSRVLNSYEAHYEFFANDDYNYVPLEYLLDELPGEGNRCFGLPVRPVRASN